MKIEAIETFLMQAGGPPQSAWGGGKASHLSGTRNWIFVRIRTDQGVDGLGEGSGWPRVLETAINDIAPLLIGEDATAIERLWQKMRSALMAHGDTGTVAAGVMTAIDMALWDIAGKSLGVPDWRLLGGKLRDRVPAYAHAPGPAEAEELVARGYRAVKTGGVAEPAQRAAAIRRAVGPDVDIAVDLHGPPWLTPSDAIAEAAAMAPLHLLFLEEPLPPEAREGWKRLRAATHVPLASGERLAGPWHAGPWLSEGLVDVIQPDSGRAAGITGLRKIAAMAEARGVTIAPHSGSLGPLAEFAAIHIMAAIPNALIMERLDPDWDGRTGAVPNALTVKEGFIAVPDTPGLGAVIDEAVIRTHASVRNIGIAKGGWEPGTENEFLYTQARRRKAARANTD